MHVTKDLNSRIPDIQSRLTGKGKHNRLLVFWTCAASGPREVTVREDFQGLPKPTEEDILKRINDDFGEDLRYLKRAEKLSLRYVGMEEYDDEREYFYLVD